jgi:DNA-directed RNA polymerase specialized sigma24 family protein
MTGPEAAKILEIPVGTVWRHLHEARHELKRSLERRPSTISEPRAGGVVVSLEASLRTA